MEKQLEERYIVLKLKDMSGFQRDALETFLFQERLTAVDCVVVEKDWPEYAPTVSALQARDTCHKLYSAGMDPTYTPACTKPPKGWHCTRSTGHAGPCATVRDRV